MNKFYAVVQIEENGKFGAFGRIIYSGDNVIKLAGIENVVAANLCKTEKEMHRLVNLYNDDFKVQGRYLYSYF